MMVIRHKLLWSPNVTLQILDVMDVWPDSVYFIVFMYSFDVWGWEKRKCKNV